MADNKNFSLSDLLGDESTVASSVNTTEEETIDAAEATASTNQYEPVKISDMRPAANMHEEKEKVTNEVAKQITGAIDMRMEQIRETKEQVIESVKEATIQEDLAAELGDTEEASSNNITMKQTSTVPGVPYTDDDEDEDLYDINDEDLSDMEKELEAEISSIDSSDSVNDDQLSEEDREILSNEIKKYINPVKTKIDLSQFSVSNSTVNIAAAAKHLVTSVMNKPVQSADYVLIDTGRVVSMSAFDSDDLEKVNNAFYMRDSFNAAIDRWQVFYDHCIDTDKPMTLEAWLRGISASDFPHIYGAAYAASFKGSNYIPYTCDNADCKKPYIPGETSFESLLKFKDEAARKRYKDILAGNRMENDCLIPRRVQVSDSIVIDIVKPSIYTAYVESVAIDPTTKRKYAETINLILQISNIYIIDYDTMSLKPIEYKVDKNNMAKSLKYKIVAFSKILKTLDSDQKGIILSIISEFANNDNLISYVTPATTCTHCGHVKAESEASIIELLFTRLRLTALTRSSTK
jgi:hypothetical protein